MTVRVIAKNILDLKGIVGIGRGSGYKIYVESEEYAEAVPKAIGGVPVEVKVTGRIYALSFIPVRKSEVTPLVGGVSISSDIIKGAGTLGVIHNGKIYTNAHVIAMDSNFEFVDKQVNIVQPGILDGGHRVVGKLDSYIEIVMNDLTADNEYDIAYGIPLVDYIEDMVLGDEGIYRVSFESVTVKSGDKVRKTGRTTGTTYGIVDSPNASIKVYYGDKWAVFHNVVSVLTEGFCAGGDSGSLVDKDGKAVGLLFAGTEKGYGFICRLPEVKATEDKTGVMAGFSLVGLLGLLSLLHAR